MDAACRAAIIAAATPAIDSAIAAGHHQLPPHRRLVLRKVGRTHPSQRRLMAVLKAEPRVGISNSRCRGPAG
jgi:hypothetical protein